MDDYGLRNKVALIAGGVSANIGVIGSLSI